MKSKKKLLLMGVGVMGALAMGVGATSTFAWFKSAQSFTANTATGALDVDVGSNTYALGAFSVPVIVSATASMDEMGLAHFGDPEDTDIPNYDDAVAPYLTTGYLDNVNTFHELGYVDGTGAPNLGDWTNTVSTLTTTVSFSINIDWTIAWASGENGGWFQQAACTAAATSEANATHFKDASGNIYDRTTVLTSLRGDTVTVAAKPACVANAVGARIIKAGSLPTTAVAESGDPLIASGCTATVIYNTKTYAVVNSAQPLTGIGEDENPIAVTGTILMYCYGGTSSTSHNADVSCDLDLYLVS